MSQVIEQGDMTVHEAVCMLIRTELGGSCAWVLRSQSAASWRRVSR